MIDPPAGAHAGVAYWCTNSVTTGNIAGVCKLVSPFVFPIQRALTP